MSWKSPVLHVPGRIGGEFQATGFGISLYQSVQARLVNGNFVPVEALDLAGV